VKEASDRIIRRAEQDGNCKPGVPLLRRKRAPFSFFFLPPFSPRVQVRLFVTEIFLRKSDQHGALGRRGGPHT